MKDIAKELERLGKFDLAAKITAKRYNVLHPYQGVKPKHRKSRDLDEAWVSFDIAAKAKKEIKTLVKKLQELVNAKKGYEGKIDFEDMSDTVADRIRFQCSSEEED